MQQRVEALAEPVHFGAGPETDQSRCGHIEGDLTRLRKQIQFITPDPAPRPFCDDPLHQRQIAGHECCRKRGVHHLTVAAMLLAIHHQ